MHPLSRANGTSDSLAALAEENLVLKERAQILDRLLGRLESRVVKDITDKAVQQAARHSKTKGRCAEDVEGGA
jgi:hypothetical protein